MQPRRPSSNPIQPKPPTESNPYDFILNKPPEPKSGFDWKAGGKQKILFIAAGGGVVLVLILLIASMIFGSSGPTEEYVSLAQEQTEIIRVADRGVKQARSAKAKALAVTTKQSLETTRISIIAILEKHGRKLKNNQLSAKENQNTDKALDSAAFNNRFDEEFMSIVTKSLQNYQASLKQIHDLTTSKSEKDVLSGAFNDLNILIDPELVLEE